MQPETLLASGPDELTPAAEPRPLVLVLFLVIAALLPRLAVFPINENLHGDAVVRTELAERWAANPHWIDSFHDGAYQFGPLHLYAVGAVLKVWPDRADAGRAVSLLFGTLSVLPLYFLTRRLFGWKAGLVAGLGFAAWGMHIQMSTTAASEALSLFLLLGVLASFARGWEEGRMRPLFISAVLLNLACATRYDTWMLIPLLSVLLLFGDRDKVAAVTRAVLFALLCLPFPLFWMQGNEVATGSALYPVKFIQDFHDSWAAAGVGTYGAAGFRLMNVLFWPGMALFTLTPLVALFGMVGMVSVWRKMPQHRWLIWVALLPTAYFTFRAAVMADFVPLGRFTVNQIVLLLPFVAAGFVALTARVPTMMRHGLVGVTAIVATALPLWLGLFTWQAEEGMPVTLNPVSPIAQNPPAVMHAARFIEKHIAPGEGDVVLDADGKFSDIQLAFFSGLSEKRLIRARWPDFDKRLLKYRPEYVVRIEGAALDQRADFDSRDHRVQLGEHWYEEVPGLRPPLHLYQRVRSQDVPPATGTAAGDPRLSPAPPPVSPDPGMRPASRVAN